MLTYLSIENFAIIEKCTVEFHSGMTIITGETGAGKSIILDALQLVLGERAESHLVRKGAKKCDITAIFDIKKYPAIKDWLIEKSIDTEEECFLKRSMSEEGRSRSFINNQPVPLQLLKELGGLLVNLHGQHEHHSLLQKDTQRECVDAYGHHETLLTSIQTLYNEHKEMENQLNHFRQKIGDRESRLAFLRYQTEELSQMNLTEESLAQLEAEHKSLSSIKDHIQIYHTLFSLLQDTLLPTLNKAQQLSHPLKNLPELLESARIQCDEALHEIRKVTEGADLDSHHLEKVETQLSKIYDIARKHKLKPSALPALYEQLSQELNMLVNMEGSLQKLEHSLSKIKSEYQLIANNLSKARNKASQAIAKEVIQSLQLLNMKNAEFSVNLITHEENHISPFGAEKIEFLVSANPGQPLQPLSKVASGGELSRINLAIDLIAAKNQALPTLIFDEVDVGIGGNTAAKVGQLLKQLSQKAQVICITHQPQVAAFSQHHLHVEKTIQKNNTCTKIEYLTPEQKIQEIARMLGGLEVTPQTLLHAKELVESN